MRLKRRFYDSSINFKNISFKHLSLGITIGLVSAFIIYGFFYVIRESFRVISFFDTLPNILSESDRNFYNIFFAGLSVIFGNSITILFIFSKPEGLISRFNPKRKRILNDQIFLSFNFIYWFTKIGLVFGVFSMCCMDFEFLPYFEPLAYLLLIVFYLESWKALSSILQKNRLKIQFIHFLSLVILIFGLSRIDIVNYKSVDKSLLKNNPIIDLPVSGFYDIENDYRGLVIALKLKLNDDNILEIFTVDREQIALNQVVSYIIKERASRREETIYFLKVRVSADKNIELKYIKMLESELYTINQFKIIYDVYNEDLQSFRFDKLGINYKIKKPVFNIETNKDINIPPPFPFYKEKLNFSDTLNISISSQTKVNGLNISKDKLVEKMKNYINKSTLFLYEYDENTKYQDYINVLSAHLNAVNDLRKKEQIIFHKYDYQHDDLCRKEKRRLIDKYPIMIIEKLSSKYTTSISP